MPNLAELLLAIATFCGGSGSYYTRTCTVRVFTCIAENRKITNLDESLLICLKEETAK